MAKEQAAAEVAPPKGKGKLLIILAVVAVVLIGGGVGGFLLLSPSKESASQHAEAEEGEEGGEDGEDGDGKSVAPIYVKLETFTVNLADQERYLQAEIQLMTANAKVGEKLNVRLPEVRDVLIRLLSSKTAEELSMPEGKDKLAKEIQKHVNDVLGLKGSKGVKKVLFGTFIIQ
jgi:flagellar FliL protein